MTAEQFRAARELLGITDDELAADLRVTPAIVGAWADGTLGIPKRQAQDLAWRAALAERQQALRTSGLAECPWQLAREAAPVPENSNALLRELEATDKHIAECPICTARDRYIEEHFGPMPAPPETAWSRVFARVERVPAWARPALLGALLLGAFVSLRIVFALPMLFRTPGRLGGLLVAVAAAAAAGAAGGFAYSLTRPTLRKLGLVGAYLTGIVCVFAYMGALLIAAPVAFGEPLVEGGGDLGAFAVISLFFGLVMGHSWFRDRDGM
jgi:hypothetical protein